MIDVTQRIDQVERRVGRRVVDGVETPTVILSRIYDGSVEEVWDACTNPARIPRWFLPVSGDLRVGGRYQLEGNAGGTIERCEPPHGFRVTWEYGGGLSWLELRLSEQPSGEATRFELEQIWSATDDDSRWAQYGPGAVGVGWDLGLMGLAIHLETGETADPKAAMSWSVSEEGTRYIALSSQAWSDAAIAAGADPAEARAAAANTTAFYTGMPPES